MRKAALALAFSFSCGGGGGNGSQAVPPGLRVSAADGIELFQSPGAGETAVTGLVRLTRTTAGGSEDAITGASVKINGAALKEALPGHYDAAGLAIAPGDTLSLLAISGNDSASVTFKCPAAVSIDAPADNAQVTGGQAVQARWTGRIGYNAGLFQPQLFFRSWDPASNGVGNAYDTVALQPAQASAGMTVPSDSKPGYVLELKVPGDYADQSSTGGVGICILHRRVHLKAN